MPEDRLDHVAEGDHVAGDVRDVVRVVQPHRGERRAERRVRRDEAVPLAEGLPVAHDADGEG